ncbi:MAG: phage head morphogenesis protein [Acetobacteraceae bacterium]|nr:phage head morphogenesis protein [Acetobacteraceae bacterium]
MSESLGGVFRRPFREQVAFFRGKLGELVPTATWRDMLRDQHDRAFMVAGAQSADLLADLAAAVDRAIAGGEGPDAFRRRFREIVARSGWTGRTGEGTRAGEAWRTRVIYRTNMATSCAAGRHAQLQEFPVWIYRHGGSREPRPEHLAWNGLALPRDHPFWRTHYPPNGWGCSCYVTGASSAETARLRGGDPDRAPPAGRDARDARGLLPGVEEGWDYAPGATVAQAVRAAAAKTVAWPYEIGKAYMDAVPPARRDALAEAIRRQPETGEALRRFAEAALGERGGAPTEGYGPLPAYLTLGPLTHSEAAAAARLTGVGAIARELWDWTVSLSGIRHVLRRHGDDATERARGQVPLTPETLALLPRLLSGGEMTYAGQTALGRETLRVDGEVDGMQLSAIVEALPKRRMLHLVTLWGRAASPR